MMRIVFLVTTCFFLCSCGFIAKNVKPDDYQKLGRIGLISIVKENFILQKVGVTIVHNKLSEEETEWELNNFIMKETQDYLDNNHNLAMKVRGYWRYG